MLSRLKKKIRGIGKVDPNQEFNQSAIDESVASIIPIEYHVRLFGIIPYINEQSGFHFYTDISSSYF